jgi:hypothetical protein
MPLPKEAVKFYGGCHCGQLRIEFSTGVDPANFTPRECDCSFCQKHGAAYISDPAGRLSVSFSRGALRKYRQGSNTAEFLVCGQCGVLVAVTYEHNSRIYGAVNIGCLNGHTGLGSSVPASPQMLSPDEKVSRWLKLWVPDVELVASGA